MGQRGEHLYDSEAERREARLGRLEEPGAVAGGWLWSLKSGVQGGRQCGVEPVPDLLVG